MQAHCDAAVGTATYSSGHMEDTHLGAAFLVPRAGILKSIAIKYVGRKYGSLQEIPDGLDT